MDETPFSFEGFGELAEIANAMPVSNSEGNDLSVLTVSDGNTEVVDLFAMLRRTELVSNDEMVDIVDDEPVEVFRSTRLNVDLDLLRAQPRKVVPARVHSSMSNAYSLARKERAHRLEYLAQEKSNSNAFLWLGSLRDCNEVLEPTATSLPCSWHPLKPFHKSPSYVMVVPGQRTGARGPLPQDLKASVSDQHSFIQTKKPVVPEPAASVSISLEVKEEEKSMEAVSSATFAVAYNEKENFLKVYNTQELPITIRVSGPETGALSCETPVLKIAPLSFTLVHLKSNTDVFHEVWKVECAETAYSRFVLLSRTSPIKYPAIDLCQSAELPISDSSESLLLPGEHVDRETLALPLPIFARYLRALQELVECVDSSRRPILHSLSAQGVSDFLQKMPYTRVSRRVQARLLSVLSRKDSVSPVINSYIVSFVNQLFVDVLGNIPRWVSAIALAFPLPLVPVRQPGVRPDLVLNASIVTKREKIMVLRRELLASMLRQAARGMLVTVQAATTNGKLHQVQFQQKMKEELRQTNVLKVKLSQSHVLPLFTAPASTNKRRPVTLTSLQQDLADAGNLQSAHGFTAFATGPSHAAASTKSGGFVIWPVVLAEEDSRKSARSRREHKNAQQTVLPSFGTGVTVPHLQGVHVNQLVCMGAQLTFILTEDGSVLRWPPVNPDTGALRTLKSLLDVRQSVWECKDSVSPPSVRVLEHFDHLRALVNVVPPRTIRNIAQNVLLQAQSSSADAPLSPRNTPASIIPNPATAMRAFLNKAKQVSNQALFASAQTFYHEQTSVLSAAVHPKLAVLPLTPVSPPVMPSIPYVTPNLWAQAVLYTLRCATSSQTPPELPLRLNASLLTDTGNSVVEPLLSCVSMMQNVVCMAGTGDAQTLALFLVDRQGQLFAVGDAAAARLGLVPSVSATPVLMTNFSRFHVTRVVCGAKHVMVCTREGAVYQWGVGFGSTDLKSTNVPTAVSSLCTAGRQYPADLPWEISQPRTCCAGPLVPPCLPLAIALTATTDTCPTTRQVLRSPFTELISQTLPFTDTSALLLTSSTPSNLTITGSLPSVVVDLECAGNITYALTKNGACYSNEQLGTSFLPAK